MRGMVSVRTLALALLATLAALLLIPAAPAAADDERHERRGAPYSLLQMNLCLSGYAGCFGGTEYPKVVDEAITRIRDNDVNAVTLNEACSGDVERIAAETGYHSRFATVIYNGAPLPCKTPDGRGVFGNAVLTKEAIRRSHDAPFAVFNGVEERRWLCATTARRVTVCTAHLSTAGADAGAVNEAQCAELTGILSDHAARGTTVFAGDVNRRASCAPRGQWTLTDAAAQQAPGIQHVYGTAALARPRLEIEPAMYTDHDVMVVRARLRR